MPELPVIFLAYANDQVDKARFLRKLSMERKMVRAALEPALAADLCELVVIENASIEQIFNTFQKKRYQNRIAIFHYGGHADGYQLLLESDEGTHEVAHGSGLVSFLGAQDSLQLVFLNGCSTRQQSEELSQVGVPIVLGTSSEIEDGIATQLAARFYHGLAQGESLDRAWNIAESEFKIRNVSAGTRSAVVVLRRKGDELEADTGFPWNMFVRQGSEVAKNWNLPSAAENPLFQLPLLPNVPLPEDPFPFLDRYRRNFAQVYFGRGHQIRDLFQRVTDPTSAPLILLYGKAGVGKSSLLDAGLAPRLEKNMNVHYLRRHPEKSLFQLFKSHLGNDPEAETKALSNSDEIIKLETISEEFEPSLRDRISSLIKELKSELTNDDLPRPKEKIILEETRKPVVILFDQIEEVFTNPNSVFPNELEEFLEYLKYSFSSAEGSDSTKVVLSYRKEFHPEIEKKCLNLRIPREQVYLEVLDRPAIMQVVNGLESTPNLKNKYRVETEDLLGGSIADDLLADKNSSIAPILQILLKKMYDQQEGQQVREFKLEDYLQLQKNGILLDDFFKRQLYALKEWNEKLESSGLALDLLSWHISDFGTSQNRKLSDLQSRYQHRQEYIDDLLAKCKELYLLTDQGSEQTTLAHDTLAPLIAQEMKISDRPGQKANRVLENKKMASLLNPETIIEEDDLQLVEEGKDGMRIWVSKEREMIERSRAHRAALEAERRRNRLFKRFAIGALAAFAIVVSWLAYQSNQEAKANKITALALEMEQSDATRALRLVEQAHSIRPKNENIQMTLGRIFSTHSFYEKAIQHNAPIFAVAVSHDGEILLSGDSKGNLWRMDANGNLIDTSMIHKGGILDIEFSHDDQYFVTGGEDRFAKLWDRNGNLVQLFDGHRNAIHAVAFTPDDNFVITGSRDRKAIIWNRKGEPVDTLAGHRETIYDLDISKDQRIIATASGDHTVKLWTLDGQLKTTLDKHSDRVLSVKFSPDGKNILTGSRDQTAIIWDTTGKVIRQMMGHESRINDVQFDDQSTDFYTASDDRKLIQWTRQGAKVQDYIGHDGYINDIAIIPTKRTVLSASEDGTLKSWGLDIKTLLAIQHPTDGIGAAAVSLDRKLIATGGYRFYSDPLDEEFDDKPRNQNITIWNQKGITLHTLIGHTDGITSVVITPDNEKIISGSKDGTTRLWNIKEETESPIESRIIDQQDHPVISVIALGVNQLLIAASNGMVKIKDINGQLIDTISHGSKITAIAVSPDNKILVTAGNDKTIRKWNISNPEKEALSWPADKYAVSALAFSPDGKMICAGDENNQVTLRSANGETLLKKRMADQNLSGFGSINAIQFHPNQNLIALGDAGGNVTFISRNGNVHEHYKMPSGITSISILPESGSIWIADQQGSGKIFFLMDEFLRNGRLAKFELLQ